MHRENWQWCGCNESMLFPVIYGEVPPEPLPSAAAKGPKATCPNRSDQVCHRVTSEIAGEKLVACKCFLQIFPTTNSGKQKARGYGLVWKFTMPKSSGYIVIVSHIEYINTYAFLPILVVFSISRHPYGYGSKSGYPSIQLFFGSWSTANCGPKVLIHSKW